MALDGHRHPIHHVQAEVHHQQHRSYVQPPTSVQVCAPASNQSVPCSAWLEVGSLRRGQRSPTAASTPKRGGAKSRAVNPPVVPERRVLRAESAGRQAGGEARGGSMERTVSDHPDEGV
jgi:hypothetical protein